MNNKSKLNIIGTIAGFALLTVALNTSYFITNLVVEIIVGIVLTIFAIACFNLHNIYYKIIKKATVREDKKTVSKIYAKLVVVALGLAVIISTSILLAIYL